MTAHQKFGQFAVTVGDGIENAVVFGKGLAWPVGRGGELDTVHAHQLVQLATQHLDQRLVTAALDDAVMEVVVALLLVVTQASLERGIPLMGIEHPAQLVDIGLAHAFSGQAAGHAFQGLTNLVQLDQFGMVERYHPCAYMGHPHQQALAFQAVDGLAQRPAADAIGACQLWLGDLAARGNFPFDDGRLNTPEDVFRQGFRFVCQHRARGGKVLHIVDTLGNLFARS